MEILNDHFILIFCSGLGCLAFLCFRFWPKQTRKALNGMLAFVWAAKRIKDDKADAPPVIPPFDATQTIPKVEHPKKGKP